MSLEAEAPRQVRAAGVLVGVQGLIAFGFAIALLGRALTAAHRPSGVIGEAAYFTVLAAGVTAVAVGLLRGRRWARTPAVVVQLLLLGVAWYLIGSSGQQVVGGLVAAFCVVVLVLLFAAPARAWVLGVGPWGDGGDRRP